jgi:hypothetical protein
LQLTESQLSVITREMVVKHVTRGNKGCCCLSWIIHYSPRTIIFFFPDQNGPSWQTFSLVFFNKSTSLSRLWTRMV